MENNTNTQKQTHLKLVEPLPEAQQSKPIRSDHPEVSGSKEGSQALIAGTGLVAGLAVLSAVAGGSSDKVPTERVTTPATPNIQIVPDDQRAAQLDPTAPRVTMQELDKFRVPK